MAAATALAAAVLGAGLWYRLDAARAPAGAAPPVEAEAPLVSAILNTPRPAFTLADLSGAPRAVDEWNGKVVAINFWATWCPPCKREIPGFNALQQEFGDAGLQFVGVAVDDHAAVRAYVAETDIDYPVLVSERETDTIAVAEQYGNLAGVLPYTVIVDRQGRIAYVRFGELAEDVARDVIRSLL